MSQQRPTDNIYDAIRKKLREEMNINSDEILTKRLDLDEYRRLQGVIEGLAVAERFVLDLAEAFGEDEDNLG